jgi:hypothetical protein
MMPADPDEEDGEDDEKPEKTKIDYPSFYCDGAPKELYDVAEEGTALVKYRVTNRTESERDGEKSYSVTIEIQSFDPQVKRNGSGPLSKTKDRMDAYMEGKR